MRASGPAKLLEVNRQYLRTMGGREMVHSQKHHVCFDSPIFQNKKGLVFLLTAKILSHTVGLLFRKFALVDFPPAGYTVSIPHPLATLSTGALGICNVWVQINTFFF